MLLLKDEYARCPLNVVPAVQQLYSAPFYKYTAHMDAKFHFLVMCSRMASGTWIAGIVLATLAVLRAASTISLGNMKRQVNRV